MYCLNFQIWSVVFLSTFWLTAEQHCDNMRHCNSGCAVKVLQVAIQHAHEVNFLLPGERLSLSWRPLVEYGGCPSSSLSLRGINLVFVCIYLSFLWHSSKLRRFLAVGNTSVVFIAEVARISQGFVGAVSRHMRPRCSLRMLTDVLAG